MVMKLSICGVLPSRIKFLMALFTIMTSHAAARPPARFGNNCCESTARNVVESCNRI